MFMVIKLKKINFLSELFEKHKISSVYKKLQKASIGKPESANHFSPNIGKNKVVFGHCANGVHGVNDLTRFITDKQVGLMTLALRDIGHRKISETF